MTHKLYIKIITKTTPAGTKVLGKDFHVVLETADEVTEKLGYPLVTSIAYAITEAKAAELLAEFVERLGVAATETVHVKRTV